MSLRKILKSKYFFPSLIFLLTLTIRFYNLFGYPYFENDEGVYTSQAWWLGNFGKLAPYTYWYDHAPFGWLFIGLWQKLTAGPFSFGFSLYSTRILMALLTAGTNLLVFKLLLLLTKNKKTALLACTALAFSPLAVIYQRRVLLDNIETFWLLLSLWFFFSGKGHLKHFFLSGLFFGLSFLSKESVIFLLPVMIYAVYLKADKELRRHALLIWTATALFLISLFPLLALLKGELFPSSWFRYKPHVSLIETVQYQLSRGTELKPWQPESVFMIRLKSWLKTDFYFLFIGAWAFLANLLYHLKDKNKRIIILLTFSYLFFLVRGGLVLEFYILPLLPLLALNIGFAFDLLLERVAKKSKQLNFLVFPLSLLAVSGVLFFSNQLIYRQKPTKQQLQAVAYVKENIDEKAFIVIDNYAFLDLRLAKNKADKVFPNADWFWKVEYDQEIKEGKLKSNWQNIDYILLSGEMRRKLLSGELPFLKQAFDASKLIKDFPSDNAKEQGDITRMKREGDGWQALFKVKKEEEKRREAEKQNETIDLIIKKLSFEQKVGLLFMVGFDGASLDGKTKGYIKNHNFNAFFLNSKNIEDKEKLKELTNNVVQERCAFWQQIIHEEKPNNDCPVSPLIAIDQEGGSVDRLAFSDIDHTAQFEIKNKEEVYRIALERAKYLKEFGINLNFAPVVDIIRNKMSYINISGRAFLGDEGQVASLSAAMVQAYGENKILSVLKHFPGGLGRVIDDPHQALPIIDIEKAEVDKDLSVYKKLIADNKAQAIMVTHLLYPQIDESFPSSLSQGFIKSILREELNFEGLVIADDLAMNSITANYAISEAAKAAFQAGVDLILISDYKENQEAAYQAILDAVKSGEISEERINDSLRKILSISSTFRK